MKLTTTLILFVFICLNFSYAQDLELELFASNLDRPVNIKHAGDARLFVVEQDGLIKIINADGTIETTPFLDIDGRVRSIGNEQGLLGLAFHPDYINNGYFFLNYINNSGNTVIARFSRNATNTSLADSNSELIILTYSQPFSNHNGGELAFGSDGYLYISSGDGGSGNDPQNNSQNLGRMLGKLLRIDVNNSTVAAPYAIPTDNPFVGIPNANDEIWAYGLRNPWKFSFDRSTNDLWIADVGQSAREEIDFTLSTDTGGLNYGWRCYEGTIEGNAFDAGICPDESSLVFPVSEYTHTSGRCSITGGYVYRGSVYPNFEGLYFFADVCSQEIGYLRFENGSWNSTFASFSGSWVAFGEDINGELYIASISGNLFKLTDTTLNIEENRLHIIPIFPNPTNDKLYIDFSKITQSVSDIIIYNIQGKAVKTLTRNDDYIQNIKVSDLSKGIYILKINSIDGHISTQKLIIN
jgi:glucose/arabinose dehydrogenase